MRVHYISPSTLPSRTANSVHVAWQCDGLAKNGADVVLYARRSVADPASLEGLLEQTYGIDASLLTLVSCFSRREYATSARIAAMAATRLGASAGETIISRNLYASFLLGVLQRRPLIFETHQLERGWRKTLQRLVMTRPWIATVVISDKLVEHLFDHHGVRPRRVNVLHDAAPAGIVPLEQHLRRARLQSLVPDAAGHWGAICGYFGQLYSGRGIEIVERLAAADRRILFLVYGGNEGDVRSRRAQNAGSSNLRFMGHVAHPEARALMAAMDVLLMPYQQCVSIGAAGHDTAQWMSPMKMFEYLAAGVPIVASDLASLREVLQDNRNCLLVPPDRPDAWLSAIQRVVNDNSLAARIARQGHADYQARHTWTHRAAALLEIARDL